MLLRLVVVEAGMTWLVGAIAGLLIAEVISTLLFGAHVLNGGDWAGVLVSVFVGLALTCGTILAPAFRFARSSTVAGARRAIGPARVPIWRVVGLDLILLALSAIVYGRTAASGYQIILASEGVAAISVDYWAFLARSCCGSEWGS